MTYAKRRTLSPAIFLLGICSSLLLSCKTTSRSDILSADDAEPTADVVVTNPGVFDCKALDYGIYWYGKGNQAIKATDGHPSRFYDPSKPTVIYVHGWQRNAHIKLNRETFKLVRPDTQDTVDTAAAWIDAGWNIGVFYWQQFADEDDVRNAEAKIWTAKGPAGTRWRTCDGSFSTAGAPSSGMGEMFFESYKKALQGYGGPNVRIVGHSLGNQMAARLTDLIATDVAAGQLPPALLPKRVALVDPFWSTGLANLDSYPGALVRDIVGKTMSQGILYEWYKDSDLLELGSIFGAGDVNKPLINMIGQVKLNLAYIADVNLITRETARHVIAPRLYFWSMGLPPPRACDTSGSCEQHVPSASMHEPDLAAFIHQTPQTWVQKSGASTSDLTDDTYAPE